MVRRLAGLGWAIGVCLGIWVGEVFTLAAIGRMRLFLAAAYAAWKENSVWGRRVLCVGHVALAI